MDDRKMPAPTPNKEHEDLVLNSIPVIGSGNKIWHVLVRHSPFLLKRCKVRAETKEDAKRLFLDEVRRRHDERSRRQKMDEWGRLASERIQAALTEGLRANEAAELAWSIVPVEDESKRRQQIRYDIDSRWNEPRLAIAR